MVGRAGHLIEESSSALTSEPRESVLTKPRASRSSADAETLRIVSRSRSSVDSEMQPIEEPQSPGASSHAQITASEDLPVEVEEEESDSPASLMNEHYDISYSSDHSTDDMPTRSPSTTQTNEPLSPANANHPPSSFTSATLPYPARSHYPSSSPSTPTLPPYPGPYSPRTTYQVVLETIEREGISGLYSGLSSSLLAIAVTNGVYYYFYERTRGVILKSRVGSKGLSTVESMLTGLIAGNPLWVIQTSQAVQTLDNQSHGRVKKLGFVQAIQNILAKSGIEGFFRGIGPALVLTVNPIIQYTVFEQLKNLLISKRTARLRAAGAAVGVVVLSDFDFFILGALSKLVATLTTYPYIVVKSRLQAGSTRYKSSFDGISTIIKDEGVSGLWKGAGSKLTQSVLTAAILFAAQKRIYEMTKTAMAAASK
ncbi:hypothetical protein V5O48_002464 [Marasmius crinis-equi]|uniref:Uncharacterized protein n=1 Tax=Marasmius crinis-equi TaxID=585013 RepID=A0ABR3FVJ4_9AGAR